MKTETEALRELTGLPTTPRKGRARYDLSDLRDFDKGEINQETAALIAAMSKRGISEVMRFCLGERHTTEKSLTIAMRRFVSIAWLLHSEMLVGEDGEPLTLNELGQLPQIDCTRCSLSLLAQKFGDRFKFHGRVQKRVSTKTNYAAAAKTGWEKRRQRQESE